MSKAVISVQNVSKSFGRGKNRVDAVKAISFEVQSQQVYGFLGPNGAGKSSTIRMIMDLVRPTQGHIFVYGKDVQKEPTILKRVGALVEGAQFYPFLTGRKNLEVLAQTTGGVENGRVQEMLNFVSLAQRGDQLVKGYSTGMKQRLGVAAALLHNPDLIILDEPTNGLDPAGIQEMRTIIRDLTQHYGKTVFLSSHMLHEVEIVCDQVAIIQAGTIIHAGTISALQNQSQQIVIEVDQPEKAQAIINLGWTAVLDENRLKVTIPKDEVPALVKQLVEANIALFQLEAQKKSLESFFLELTAVNQGQVA